MTSARKTSPAICTCFTQPHTVVMENIAGKKKKRKKKKNPSPPTSPETTRSIKSTAILTCCKVLCWSTKSDASLHMHDTSEFTWLNRPQLNCICLGRAKTGGANTSNNINMHTGHPARKAGQASEIAPSLCAPIRRRLAALCSRHPWRRERQSTTHTPSCI